MREVTVVFTETQARALLPQNGRDQDALAWNRRMDAAEDAQAAIRAALREQAPEEPMRGQASLGGMT